MRKRKLITERTLRLMQDDQDRGVPLARAMANQNLVMSRPAVKKLVDAYQLCQTKPEISKLVYSSLFPAWLDVDGQEQPDNSNYNGFFPYGEWV